MKCVSITINVRDYNGAHLETVLGAPACSWLKASDYVGNPFDYNIDSSLSGFNSKLVTHWRSGQSVQTSLTLTPLD
jgi:hypothetical protein